MDIKEELEDLQNVHNILTSTALTIVPHYLIRNNGPFRDQMAEFRKTEIRTVWARIKELRAQLATEGVV